MTTLPDLRRRLPACLHMLSLAFCLTLALLAPDSAAKEAGGAYRDLEARLTELTQEDLQELLVFVAGNALLATDRKSVV